MYQHMFCMPERENFGLLSQSLLLDSLEDLSPGGGFGQVLHRSALLAFCSLVNFCLQSSVK